MARYRMCASCARKSPIESVKCLNPVCGVLFNNNLDTREEPPKRSGLPRCSEPGCDRIGTILINGATVCGEHFDSRRYGGNGTHGAGYDVWRRAIDFMRESRAKRQQGEGT